MLEQQTTVCMDSNGHEVSAWVNENIYSAGPFYTVAYQGKIYKTKTTEGAAHGAYPGSDQPGANWQLIGSCNDRYKMKLCELIPEWQEGIYYVPGALGYVEKIRQLDLIQIKTEQQKHDYEELKQSLKTTVSNILQANKHYSVSPLVKRGSNIFLVFPMGATPNDAPGDKDAEEWIEVGSCNLPNEELYNKALGLMNEQYKDAAAVKTNVFQFYFKDLEKQLS